MRRTKIDFFIEILRYVKKEVIISDIVHEIKTNHKYVRKALDPLIKNEFVETDGKHYWIMDKGLKFLEEYDDFNKKWSFPLLYYKE